MTVVLIRKKVPITMTQRLRRKSSSLYIRLAALVCAIALLVNGMALFDIDPVKAPALITVSAATSAELEQQKQDILDKQKELEAKRNAAAATLEELEAEKATIEAQIQLQLDEIALLEAEKADLESQVQGKQAQMDAKQTELDTQNAQITAKQAEIVAEYEALKTRLRELSKTNTLTSYMQLLIAGDEFTDYLIMNKMSELIAQNTARLMEQMEAELQTLNAEKDKLEAEYEALEKQKAAFELQCKPYYDKIAELDAKKQELDRLYSERVTTTDKLNQNIDKYNADIAAAEKEAEKLEDLINQAIAKENGYSGSYNGSGSGSMGWPAYDCNYISSTFKFRWGRWHRGIDICGSGCYGTRINAAAKGRVIYADWMSGYGLCIMIDHGYDNQGRNIVTLYAHASALHVSYGQTVTKGQHISNIGTTGNVTGPHLHFEVRVNGTAVDPIANGYISTSGIIVDESL